MYKLFLKCFWSVFSQNPSLLSFSFPLLKLFSFYFLSSILLEISKCLISQTIGGLIKTALKHFFKGVAHEQPWSSIVYVCCGGRLLCPAFFEVIVFLTKSFSPSLCYIICLLLSSILLASSHWFLWYFYKVSMEILCNFHGASMIFYGASKGVSMVVLWESYGNPKGCPWDFLWIAMGFLWYF